MKKKNYKRLGIVAFLQLAVCFYTLSGIAAKLASHYDFLSVGFIVCYAAEILVLGFYAIVWQQIIKRIDISIAYANKAMAIFWSTLWAVLLFHEQITWQNIIGILLIFAGITIVNQGETE